MEKKEDNKKTEELKLIEKLKQFREKFEARWYIASAFYDGFHFSWGKQDDSGQWIQSPTPKGKIIRQIPKAKKQLNNMRNMLLKVRLKPVVYPDKNVLYNLDANGENTEEIEKEENAAIKMGNYIDYELMEKMKLMKLRKTMIRKAQLMGHSYVQILNDSKTNEKKLEVYDAFDWSVPFGIDQITNVAVKHVVKKLSDLKKNKNYDQKVITKLEEAVDGKYSESKYKQAMLSEKYGSAPEDTVFLDELYILEERDGEDDEKLSIYTYLGEEQIRKQETNLNKLPVSMFVWDDSSYQTSVMEDLMPLNRSYDVFISKLEHKVKKLDTGRYLVQKRESIKPMTTNDGEFIRYKRVKPDVMPESQVSQAFYSLIGLIEGDMKEQGVALAAGGDVPSGVKAWRAIEALKEADYASLGNQIENLQNCMTDLTEKLIDMIASDMTTPEIAQIPGEGKKTEVFKVVGRAGADLKSQGIDDNTIVIDPNRTVKVEHEATIGWTEAGKRDLVMELVQAQLLPVETAVKMLEIGNTREIMKQMEMEQTKGKSIIDMPDFKLLPKELQVAIVKYLSSGGVINDPNATEQDIKEVKNSVKP